MSNNNNFSAQADQFGKEMSGKLQNAAGEFKEQSQAAKEQGHNLMNKAEQNLPEAKKQGHSLLEQGQEYLNQATNYVHEHSQNLLNKGAEGAAEGSEQG